ncbi:MAG: hypothetical protein ACRC62_06060 [Microcoleus sp.]
MMNLLLKGKVAITSIIATSLLSVVNPTLAASPISSTPNQLNTFTIPKQQPEVSVNNGFVQNTIPVSFLDIPIDYIINVSGGQSKNTGDRQLLVKQRYRPHEMFIVSIPICTIPKDTEISSLKARGNNARQLSPIDLLQGIDRGH